MEFHAKASRGRWVAWPLLAFALLSVTFGAGVVLAPTSLVYALDAERLVVDATLGGWGQGEVVPRAALGEARAVTLHGGRRDVGVGLPGYCQGRWSYPELGAVWQATSCGAAAVVIAGPDGPIVVTPADRDGFLAALATPGAAGRFEPAPSSARRPPHAAVVVGFLALALLTLAGVARVVLRPMVYRVEGDALIVPAHFRAVRVRLAGAKATRGPLGRALRIGGSSLPGFHLGLFRAGGRTLHVAATDLKDGVLVEGDRVVFVSPADPEAFLATLRR